MKKSDEIISIIRKVGRGELTAKQAEELIKKEEDLGFARIDLEREERCGFPEVVFAQNKSPENSLQIAKTLLKNNGYAFLTRVPKETSELLCAEFNEHDYNKEAKTLIIGKAPTKSTSGRLVIVISAGTSDIPVAEEARITAEIMGCRVEVLHDCGVAGLHRLLAVEDKLREAAVIIVTAGMEGALPSVVGGLVDAPVIAVPTSVGYGASFNGIAALLGMLNSCASGVGVVNIDNGFGAGCLAAKIIRKVQEKE